MLFLFLLKGLFKRNTESTEHMVRVTEKEQPALFAFVRRLCSEGKSPFPKTVYLTPEVNAAVFYPRSLFSLVWPIRKNLLVGLGLTNALNLLEFKAVLAHEFGHFSQSSMKLGQYVYVANQVIADMVFGRDRWDGLLEKWRGIDLRLSLPAWVLSAIVWALRHVLGLIFRGINILNFSLSRQMEFNADLHAARLTGSDALICGLWKVERASIAQQIASHELVSIAQHGKYSDDVFHHQTLAFAKLDEMLANADDDDATRALREPYQYGPELHFKPSDTDQASMWSTHPPSHEREANVKRSYIPAEPDERSAWCLFRNVEKVRDRVGVEYYKETLGVGDRELANRLPATDVEALIREETAETKQAEHYHGLYDDRPLRPGKIHEISEEISLQEKLGTLDLAKLREPVERWRGESLEAFMKDVGKLDRQIEKLAPLVQASEQSGGKSIQLKGKSHSLHEVKLLLHRAEEAHKAKRTELERADEAAFWYFYARGDVAQRADLARRYEFLLEIQESIESLLPIEQEGEMLVAYLQSGDRPSPEDFQQIHGMLTRGSKALLEVYRRSDSVLIPALSNIDEDATVASFVFPKSPPPVPASDGIDGDWLGRYFGVLQPSLFRLRKLHFKNLGHVLRLQEAIDPEFHGVSVASPESASPESASPDSAAS